MVGINSQCPAKDHVLKLMVQKDVIERAIKENTEILMQNNIGLHEPLVDDEGYPRNDIDVYKVRHARHNIICLQNDHKNVMKLIEKGLNDVGTFYKELNGAKPSQMPTTSTNELVTDINDDSLEYKPFATVSGVQIGSAADLAGICAGDELIHFGTLNYNNYKDRNQISELARHSMGKEMRVQVRRQHSILNLIVIPQLRGQSLLGIQIV